jgi:hypothetical protein
MADRIAIFHAEKASGAPIAPSSRVSASYPASERQIGVRRRMDEQAGGEQLCALA